MPTPAPRSKLLELCVQAIPPSVNGYWKVRRFGGRYITPEGVAFKRMVYLAAQEFNFALLETMQYRCDIFYYSPRWVTKSGAIRKVDLDNLAKSSLDSLSEAIGIDDSQIFTLRMHKVESAETKTVFNLYEF